MGQFEKDATVPVPLLKESAAAEGIAWRTIERAKGRLGIESRRVGGVGAAGQWVWIARESLHEAR